jgi:serine/threonine-protein kinase
MAQRLRHRRANRVVAMVAATAGLVVLAAITPAVLGGTTDPATQQTGYYHADTPATTWSPTPPSQPPDQNAVLPEIPTDLPTYPTDTTTPTTAAPPTTTGSADAGAELRTVAEADLPVLRATLEGRWVAQLGSKRTGMTVGGTYYDDAAILADHLSMRASYPDVRLVWSGDWATFSAADFWVTLVAIPHATPEEANGWCDSHHIAAGECYAKRVSATGGGDRDTVPR